MADSTFAMLGVTRKLRMSAMSLIGVLPRFLRSSQSFNRHLRISNGTTKAGCTNSARKETVLRTCKILVCLPDLSNDATTTAVSEGISGKNGERRCKDEISCEEICAEERLIVA